MDPLPEPPVGLDLAETKVPSLVSAFVVTWSLGLACVGLRVTARKLARNKLWWDDWLILASLVFSGAFMLDVTCYMVGRGGFGKHIWAAPRDGRKTYFLGLFIGEFLCGMSIVLVKCSILAFFWRIFGSNRRTRWSIWIIFATVCAWGIAVILVGIFQCSPVSAFWRQFDPDENFPKSAYKCATDVRVFFLANGALNTITDILILVVPIPSVWSLQLGKRRRLALMAIFAVGLFVIGVSGVRIYYVVSLDLSDPDVTWLSSEETMWTGVEANVGTVCACLPSLTTLLYIARGRDSLHSPKRPRDGRRHSAIVTIGGSGPLDEFGRRMRSSPRDGSASNPSRSFKGQHTEDTQPLSALSDNGSETWVEFRSGDVEMH